MHIMWESTSTEKEITARLVVDEEGGERRMRVVEIERQDGQRR